MGGIGIADAYRSLCVDGKGRREAGLAGQTVRGQRDRVRSDLCPLLRRSAAWVVGIGRRGRFGPGPGQPCGLLGIRGVCRGRGGLRLGPAGLFRRRDGFRFGLPGGVHGRFFSLQQAFGQLQRTLVAGGRQNDRTGELLPQLLPLRRGHVQPVFHDGRVKAGGAHKVDLLREGHVAGDGQQPAFRQWRALMQIADSAAILIKAGRPAFGDRARAVRPGKGDAELGCLPDLEGKGE